MQALKSRAGEYHVQALYCRCSALCKLSTTKYFGKAFCVNASVSQASVCEKLSVSNVFFLQRISF